MTIYLLCRNLEMLVEWKQQFAECRDVDVVMDDFAHFMDTHKVQCVVSPANYYGSMDGGYDAAIIDYFGIQLEKAVQKYILDNFYGEQPVGTRFTIDIPGTEQKLIHTPTMRLPSKIREPEIVYQCMRTTLMEAIKNKIESIVIPVFGGGTGMVPYRTIAKFMKRGYDQIKNPSSVEYCSKKRGSGSKICWKPTKNT